MQKPNKKKGLFQLDDMNFLFVDRILDLEPGKRTLALKHVTSSDNYLTKNSAGEITLVPCIVGEALGQLCSWNVIKSSDFRFRLIGGIVGEVNMLSHAYLGETIVLENKIDALDLENQVVNFHGVAKVDDRIVLEIKDGLGPLLPVEDFGDVDKVKAEFASIYRPGEIPQIHKGQNIFPVPHNFNNIYFDTIVSWEKGKEVTAKKNISASAPYFVDHFPKRPVLPLTLLMESQLQIAYKFIAELVDEDKRNTIRPVCIRRIKMKGFVEPGDVLIAKMSLKEHEKDRFVLAFCSKVENKTVCVSEAIFVIGN